MGLMDPADRILHQAFADVALVSGGELYLPSSVADAALRVCRNASLAIVGIESFEVIGGRLRPDLDLIADFSAITQAGRPWGETVAETEKEARSFMGRLVGLPRRWMNLTLMCKGESGITED